MWIALGIAALVGLLRRFRSRQKRDAPASESMIVAGLLLAVLAAGIAQTIVAGALPAFGELFGASATTVAWTLTAFMLSSAVVTPIAGGLGDLFGYRPVLLGCLVCFCAGTVVAALAVTAGSLPTLIAGRALQGVAGGVFPLAFGIARTSLPAVRVPGVIALLGAMFGIGGSAAMVIGGPVVDGPGAAWLFWGTLVLAALALLLAVRLPAAGARGRGRVDLAGAGLLSGLLVCLLLGVSQGASWGWGSARVLGLFGGAVLLAVAFVVVESRVARPLVDLRVIRRRAPVSVNLVTLVTAAAMFASVTLFPQFAQTPVTAGYGFGLSAARAGLVMLPLAVATLAAGPVSAMLGRRFGGRVPLGCGAVCAAVAYGFLAVAHESMWQLYLAGAIVGAGYGLAFAALGNLTVDSVEPRHTGVATGVNTIMRTVGAALGVQITTALLATGSRGAGTPPTEAAYTLTFLLSGGLALLGLAMIAAIPRREGSPAGVLVRESVRVEEGAR
ncbi:MFS transporter [Streptosporangium saharense]|uniref:MFS family permease n=1 Tax=Streptosporangium saharense TaxID=1706840 RepID=A0A7W7VRX2_9ACTN|nr:MFS transporter [Streptosporangium saharense]MBB4919994.1 MFS family permease [Streptosporangium saharense]